jgi:nucleoside 2-deoxyribosyltransferase
MYLFSCNVFGEKTAYISSFPMKFFIASPWQNADVVKDLSVALATRGHTAYSFLDNGANAVGGAPPIEESEESFPNSIMNWENNPAVKEIFESDMKALKESDVIILLEPSGRSSLAEAGIAYGMGKKIVVVGRVAHPSVVVYNICGDRYASTDDFLASLGGAAA